MTRWHATSILDSLEDSIKLILWFIFWCFLEGKTSTSRISWSAENQNFDRPVGDTGETTIPRPARSVEHRRSIFNLYRSNDVDIIYYIRDKFFIGSFAANHMHAIYISYMSGSCFVILAARISAKPAPHHLRRSRKRCKHAESCAWISRRSQFPGALGRSLRRPLRNADDF